MLWVSDAPAGPDAGQIELISRAGVRRKLGRSYDAVVLDLHDAVDADLLGSAAGMVWGGGALLLRLDATPAHDASLAVWPHEAGDVGTRFPRRLERALTRWRDDGAPITRGPLGPTTEQDALVAELTGVLSSPRPTQVVVTAARGRGKSSAVGRALAAVGGGVVTGPSPDAVQEVLRFARAGDEMECSATAFVPPELLVEPLAGAPPRVLVIDEAASLPVPLLQAVTRAHPKAHVVFATTTQGYEGTGRGFVLRFLAWARGEGRPLLERTLSEPIRWGAGDPLERWLDDVLLLDARPASGPPTDAGAGLEARRLDRDALASDERLLRDVLGLLVHAHYRTTPSDLARLLDAPNLSIHALLERDRAVAVSIVAREGSLPLPRCEAMVSGTERIRGHALADTLVTHGGLADAGTLSMIRSVRIATHPDRRRRGLARALVEHVHESYDAELFGTVFGATPELVAFRRALGYLPVRLGSARGVRSGEPAVVMVRPCSPRAEALVARMRRELARSLPAQLALLAADGPVAPDAALAEALSLDLPAADPFSEAELLARARAYVESARTFDSDAAALRAFVANHEPLLARLPDTSRALLEERVLGLASWRRSAERARLPSVAAAMRALRPALAALVELASP